MITVALIGFLGGLITGISPCILPVLPVIFFSGATAQKKRSFLVIAGLVTSFSVFTLVGSALLSLLHLPQDAVRWVGLAALTLIGLGLIFPRVQHILELPFARIPQREAHTGRGGFGLGLAVGVLYVPCAGPVLAAIIVAGATGSVGVRTVALTLSFAVGATLPLLAFALAGQRMAERIGAFRRRQRGIRVAGGLVMVVFAVALVFNLPALVQRMIPDYTESLQKQIAAPTQIQDQLDPGVQLAGRSGQLSDCSYGDLKLQSCGVAPDIVGATGWLNTPGGMPIDLKSLRGKVVLVEFWAFSCINCQRVTPYIVNWYETYKDSGFEVIGVHTPEYAFEHVPENVAEGARGLGIEYPIALDNDYATWNNYENHYWPAQYLIDANGDVRHIAVGEGAYDTNEELIRGLLTTAHPGVVLPDSTG